MSGCSACERRSALEHPRRQARELVAAQPESWRRRNRLGLCPHPPGVAPRMSPASEGQTPVLYSPVGLEWGFPNRMCSEPWDHSYPIGTLGKTVAPQVDLASILASNQFVMHFTRRQPSTSPFPSIYTLRHSPCHRPESSSCRPAGWQLRESVHHASKLEGEGPGGTLRRVVRSACRT